MITSEDLSVYVAQNLRDPSPSLTYRALLVYHFNSIYSHSIIVQET